MDGITPPKSYLDEGTSQFSLLASPRPPAMCNLQCERQPASAILSEHDVNSNPQCKLGRKLASATLAEHDVNDECVQGEQRPPLDPSPLLGGSPPGTLCTILELEEQDISVLDLIEDRPALQAKVLVNQAGRGSLRSFLHRAGQPSRDTEGCHSIIRDRLAAHQPNLDNLESEASELLRIAWGGAIASSSPRNLRAPPPNSSSGDSKIQIWGPVTRERRRDKHRLRKQACAGFEIPASRGPTSPRLLPSWSLYLDWRSLFCAGSRK